IVAGRTRTFGDDEGNDRFAGHVVGPADYRGLGNQFRIRHQGRFDFHGSKSVAGYIEHVVDAAHDPEVTVEIAARAITGEVILALEFFWVVALAEAVRIAPDVADHRRPRFLDDQNAAFAFLDIVAGLIDDRRNDARQRHGAGAGFQWRGPGQRGDHVSAGFRLPPGVDHRTAPASDRVVVPHPGLRIDRLAHRPQ